MTVVHFVRHGQRDGANPGDPSLSTAGRAQTERATRALENEPIARVYSSPLRRAREYSGEVMPECSITSVRVDAGSLEILRIAASEHL